MYDCFSVYVYESTKEKKAVKLDVWLEKGYESD